MDVVFITLFTNIFSYQSLNLWKYSFSFILFLFDTWIKSFIQHAFSVKPVICSRGYRQLVKVFCYCYCKSLFSFNLLLFHANKCRYKILAEGGAVAQNVFHIDQKDFFSEKGSLPKQFSSTKKQVVILSSHLHNFVSLAFISEITGYCLNESGITSYSVSLVNVVLQSGLLSDLSKKAKDIV